VQQLEAGRAGVMIAVADGKYTTRPIRTCVQGVKRVDVDELYDRETYRPRIARVLDKPMFLY
jgi:6-phosphofructokinase 1